MSTCPTTRITTHIYSTDAVDSKSRTGYNITTGGTPVDWYSKKQDIVDLSTAEAEYVAMSKVGQADPRRCEQITKQH